MKRIQEVHICQGKKGSGVMGALLNFPFPNEMKCISKAKYFERDKWFCGVHAPSQIIIREEKRLELLKKRIKDRLKKLE